LAIERENKKLRNQIEELEGNLEKRQRLSVIESDMKALEQELYEKNKVSTIPSWTFPILETFPYSEVICAALPILEMLALPISETFAFNTNCDMKISNREGFSFINVYHTYQCTRSQRNLKFTGVL
jgi:hypothetical protein